MQPHGPDWRSEAARDSLKKLLPRLEETYAEEIAELPAEWDHFSRRLHTEWDRLFAYLNELYGWQYDFFYTLEQILDKLIRFWLDRPSDLKALDARREEDPHWFLSEKQVGLILYVDLFSQNLKGLHEHLSYFEKLGVTFIHLMPLFAVPHEENDGGYAVSDYRAVNPDLGTMEELTQLAAALRERGISLVLDFVLNHTSDEHEWAKKAKNGDMDYLNYYFTFSDRTAVDRFQEHLRDIFPAVRKGSFIWNDEVGRWIWTTFNNYQWDLNYTNSAVFRQMAEEMLFLANQGVEVLRLDAIAFIWKRMGTNCESLPEAHTTVRAFNAMARIVAPSMIFLSEAIVHPDEVVRYIHPDECHMSYNPLLMALLWESLATRETKLLQYSLRHRERIPSGCAWVNYLRCHDDIGWTFDDNDAWAVGINPKDHRRFLNDFYTGRHPGSFARGVPFQFNPETGDLRVSGTLSSLAGLEQAIEDQDNDAIERAVYRINMLNSVLASIGGVPFLYAGDEYGHLNDYTFLSDPRKVNDSRWVHRVRKQWTAHDDLADQDTLEYRFFQEMVKLFHMRKKLPALRSGGIEIIETYNKHLFGYIRAHLDQRLLMLHNFSEFDQVMPAKGLKQLSVPDESTELFRNEAVSPEDDLHFSPYRYMWIDISPPVEE